MLPDECPSVLCCHTPHWRRPRFWKLRNRYFGMSTPHYASICWWRRTRLLLASLSNIRLVVLFIPSSRIVWEGAWLLCARTHPCFCHPRYYFLGTLLIERVPLPTTGALLENSYVWDEWDAALLTDVTLGHDDIWNQRPCLVRSNHSKFLVSILSDRTSFWDQCCIPKTFQCLRKFPEFRVHISRELHFLPPYALLQHAPTVLEGSILLSRPRYSLFEISCAVLFTSLASSSAHHVCVKLSSLLSVCMLDSRR